MEVGLFPISADRTEKLSTTIRLTTYYDDYDGYREWFFNMLKHQPHYMDCTDEEYEEIWEIIFTRSMILMRFGTQFNVKDILSFH